MASPEEERRGEKWIELLTGATAEQMKTALVQREQIKRHSDALERIGEELERLNKTVKIIAMRRS